MQSRSELYRRLEAQLGAGSQYKIHLISTPPTLSDALFAAPPSHRPQRTHCESHFLILSTASQSTTDAGHVFVFAIEVLVYTTSTLTTLFVSKADSTGHLPQAADPLLRRQSPIRPVTSTFLTWLAETRQRPGLPLVVSLFARAQDQYLFPNSVDHGAKHVLDDRQLVKWWSNTLDPVLRTPTCNYTTCAHVIVPGFDHHETTQFFPPSHSSDAQDCRKWKHGHPLLAIAPIPSAPPRCLVPRFPDDPKARYLDELDTEIPDTQLSQSHSSPSKKGTAMWKSIKSLDDFWDMMAFRQECASGRLVGFIWLVFTPTEATIRSTPSLAPALSFDASDLVQVDAFPCSQESIGQASDTTMMTSPRKKSTRRRKLTGPIVPRQPKIKSRSADSSFGSDKSISKDWPVSGRGQLVLDQSSYDKVHDLLLRLDFGSAGAAISSTRKWLAEVDAVTAATRDWGQDITGMRTPVEQSPTARDKSASEGKVNDLSSMLVRKKRKPAADVVHVDKSAAVNVLSGSMLRKKVKPS
jgi:regulator of Ty1 transposition protein 109